MESDASVPKLMHTQCATVPSNGKKAPPDYGYIRVAFD